MKTIKKGDLVRFDDSVREQLKNKIGIFINFSQLKGYRIFCLNKVWVSYEIYHLQKFNFKKLK